MFATSWINYACFGLYLTFPKNGYFDDYDCVSFQILHNWSEEKWKRENRIRLASSTLCVLILESNPVLRVCCLDYLMWFYTLIDVLLHVETVPFVHHPMFDAGIEL